ncbi:hypothetical protein EVAR_10202_1 [Eumeta japonica]|uniref:Uncharacterized protein n=1 Tax=Eumeta variegata TaxID=151549 RepID=A0A4C1TGG9_EUMVA|nr:hypothetical protein EVAR_10202_1 [Eumeta japonica]
MFLLFIDGSSEKKYKQALKISEIADYLQDLEDCSEEDLNDIEVAILPPDEVDEVTDIEEDPDDDMGVIPVSDVTGQVEFSCTIDNVDEDHPTESKSRTRKTVSWLLKRPHSNADYGECDSDGRGANAGRRLRSGPAVHSSIVLWHSTKIVGAVEHRQPALCNPSEPSAALRNARESSTPAPSSEPAGAAVAAGLLRTVPVLACAGSTLCAYIIFLHSLSE